MELRHLRYFTVVAEELHFTRAAARLGIGQPPLSQQIQQLEREIGTALFLRLPRGVELTEAGAQFLEDARAILASADRAIDTARRLGRGEHGAITVGFTASAVFHPYLPRAIRAFRDRYPDVRISLTESNTVSLLRGLRENAVDVAFVRPPYVLDPEFESILLVDYEPLDLPKTMQSPRLDQERQLELAMRVNFVNDICRQQGKDRVIYVAVHVDASPPNDGQWHQPCGWSVRVSPKASQRSRLLAACLFDAAKAHGLKMRQPTARQKYWEQSLYVLNNTKCPAVLTENLFQDNLDEVDFLLSDEGRHVIERLHVEGIIKYIESI